MPSTTHAAQAVTEMVAVGDQRVRVAVRDGDGTQPPLLLMNGLGVSLEGLQQFVDALDPRTVTAAGASCSSARHPG